MTYQEYLACLEKSTQIFELIRIIQRGHYEDNIILFTDPNTSKEWVNKFEYCQNRFILTFMTKASESDARNSAYSLLRILEAHERFYAEYLSHIRSAPKILFDGLYGIATCLKPLKEYLKQNSQFRSSPPEINLKEIDEYLLTNASEKENGGYFNPILESFMPDVPKHYKYPLIIGSHTYSFNNPFIFEKLFSPILNTMHAKRLNQDQVFIDSYHSGVIATLTKDKISKGNVSPFKFNPAELATELQIKLQEFQKIEDDKKFLENYYNKKRDDEQREKMEETQRKYYEEHPSNPWDDGPN